MTPAFLTAANIEAETPITVGASPTSPAANLRAARALIARPGGWCRLAFARNSAGKAVRLFAQACHPTSFSVSGAIQLFTGRWGTALRPEIGFLCQAAGIRLNPFGVAHGLEGASELGYWNDRKGRTQADAVGLYDTAIALAEAAEAETALSTTVPAEQDAPDAG